MASARSVAGGEEVAVWKVELLAAAGAAVDVFSETPCRELADLVATYEAGRVSILPRAWTAADLKDAVVAFGGEEAARFSAAARALGVPVNIIDQPRYCDFQFGAIVNRSPAVIGISTGGAAPILGQAIRRRSRADFRARRRPRWSITFRARMKRWSARRSAPLRTGKAARRRRRWWC